MTYAPASIDVELKRFYLGGPKHSEVERSTLDRVLRYFFYKLGYKNTKVNSVIGALLLTGKVKVLYSNMVERVELRDHRECMQREDAERLYSDFVESVMRENMEVSFEPEKEIFNCTQMIPVFKQQAFDDLRIGDLVRGIYKNEMVLNVAITQLNSPEPDIHTGITNDDRTWFVHRETLPTSQFFQLTSG